MSKKKKKLTDKQLARDIAKYTALGAWSYPTYELIKYAGKIIYKLLKK